MIKKVAPHAVNKQIGLRKAGFSPSCKTGMTSCPGLPVRWLTESTVCRAGSQPAPEQGYLPPSSKDP